MCNLSEGIVDRTEERVTKSVTRDVTKKIILNLWKMGNSIPFIEEASGWSKKQILAVLPKDKKRK